MFSRDHSICRCKWFIYGALIDNNKRVSLETKVKLNITVILCDISLNADI